MNECCSKESSSLMLCVDGVAAIEVELALNFWKRMRGVLGRDSLAGALWLEPANGVHTLGVAMDLDVIYCSRVSSARPASPVVVVEVETMKRNRWGRPRKACVVVELAAGKAAELGIVAGSELSVGAAPSLS